VCYTYGYRFILEGKVDLTPLLLIQIVTLKHELVCSRVINYTSFVLLLVLFIRDHTDH